MRILLISGKSQDSDLFKNQVNPLIQELLKLKEFNDGTHKLGIILPGTQNQVEIKENGLITFEINSTNGEAIQIPNLTPGLVREINGFLNEFQPDIVHAYDAGFMGILAQYFSVSKKIPFVLTVLPGQGEQKPGFTSKILTALLAQMGVSADFIKNYYNNATALIGDVKEMPNIVEYSRFSGTVLANKDFQKGQQIISCYTKLIQEQKKNLRSNNEKSATDKQNGDNSTVTNKKDIKKVGFGAFLIAGAAVAGSVFAFTALKGFSKLKRTKPESKKP
jgi:hypothetical protein